MDTILTEAQCNQLEQFTNELRKYPGLLQEVVNEGQQVLGMPVMTDWIAGTAAAQSAEAELKRNMNGTNQVAERCQQIIKACETTIQWNRENNRKTIQG